MRDTKKFFNILLVFVIINLVACANSTEKIAINNGFQAKYIDTKKFHLASHQKIQQPGAAVNIYIEGDGHAWASRSRLSHDPSPQSATTMQLAALDPHPNVVYLARPCQFSPLDLKTVCESKYWSVARYSETVVQAIDLAINEIKNSSQATKINLIGYSGGGALAVLTAARRNDVASIRTVAGNLDLQAMDAIHKTTPLSESLDPIKFATKVSNIPQLHFVGGKDKIVPVVIAKNFVQAAKLNNNKVVVIDTATHNKVWDKLWPELLLQQF